MRLLNKMRRQDAIYWPPGEPDDYGRSTPGALVELVQVQDANYRVRWVDKSEEFRTPSGTVETTMAMVHVPALPNGAEVKVGGWLWLGVRADLTSETDPQANAGAYTIRRFDKTPTVKATKFLRTAYL